MSVMPFSIFVIEIRVVKSIAKIATIAKLRIAIARKSQFRKQDNPFFEVKVDFTTLVVILHALDFTCSRKPNEIASNYYIVSVKSLRLFVEKAKII